MFDWDSFIARLSAYPDGMHRLLPPCPDERIRALDTELGHFPHVLNEMLRRANGIELFCCPNATTTLFGISTIPALPPFEWAPDWHIDKFTPKWRALGSDREDDWAIAMTNYGGLVLLNADGITKEWDTCERRWLSINLPFSDWIDKEMREGDVTLAELQADERAE
jgi:hypothetical protein